MVARVLGYHGCMIEKKSVVALVLALMSVSPSLAADIYLVRHAEKRVDGSQDPDLTQEGAQRAANLAVLLKSAGIERVFSTDYTRTRKTAEPTARNAGVNIETYDPGALTAFARDLLALESNSLVVGHSNTTSKLVDLMGGDGGSPIDEEWEYDRVYLVQTMAGRVTHTVLLHLPPSQVPVDSTH